MLKIPEFEILWSSGFYAIGVTSLNPAVLTRLLIEKLD
jgi:hypothetical protein